MKLNNLKFLDTLVNTANNISKNKNKNENENFKCSNIINLNNTPRNITGKSMVNYKGKFNNEDVKLLSEQQIIQILKENHKISDDEIKKFITCNVKDEDAKLKIINARYNILLLKGGVYKKNLFEYPLFHHKEGAELVLKLLSNKYKILQDNPYFQEEIEFLLGGIANNTKEKTDNKTKLLDELLSNEHEFTLYNDYIQKDIISILAFNEIEKDEIDNMVKEYELISRGINKSMVTAYVNKYKGKSYNDMIYYLKNGGAKEDIDSILTNQSEFGLWNNRIQNEKNPIREFFNSDSYSKEIKKITKGKYQKELISLLEDSNARKSIIESNLTEEEFIKALKKFSTSTYKFAMDTPNQYLSNINIQYTTKDKDGKYPKLAYKELYNERSDLRIFFVNNIGKILKALTYTDTDTVNQMMDKRTSIFRDSLYEIRKLTKENCILLSELIKCKSSKTGKNLTAKDKIQLCKIVEIYQKTIIKTEPLKEMVQKGIVDIQVAKDIIQDKILLKSGVKKEELANIPKEKKAFNSDYSYLVLMCDKNNILDEIPPTNEIVSQVKIEATRIKQMSKEEIEKNIEKLKKNIQKEKESNTNAIFSTTTKNNIKKIEIYKNRDNYTIDEIAKQLYDIAKSIIKEQKRISMMDNGIYTIIKESVLHNFADYIDDKTNQYGIVNMQTKKIFKRNGLDYNEWQQPTIEPKKLNINGRTATIKLWDRNPYEDLFIGNKTTCCTGIGDGCHGYSTPTYLLNKTFNVIELFDENNNAIGMSRVYTANVDNKPALIMDNFELNNNYMKNLSYLEKLKIRNEYFSYANEYIQKVAKNPDAQVYLSTNYVSDIPVADFSMTVHSTSIIGKIAANEVYINAIGETICPDKGVRLENVKLYNVTKTGSKKYEIE